MLMPSFSLVPLACVPAQNVTKIQRGKGVHTLGPLAARQVHEVEFGADELLGCLRCCVCGVGGGGGLLHAHPLVDVHGEDCVAPAADVVHAGVPSASAQRSFLQAVHLHQRHLIQYTKAVLKYGLCTMSLQLSTLISLAPSTLTLPAASSLMEMLLLLAAGEWSSKSRMFSL